MKKKRSARLVTLAGLLAASVLMLSCENPACAEDGLTNRERLLCYIGCYLQGNTGNDR